MRAPAVAAVFAVVLAACSGGGDEPGASTAVPSTGTPPPDEVVRSDEVASDPPTPSTATSVTVPGPVPSEVIETVPPHASPIAIVDALADPRDVIRLASAQRGLLPTWDDPVPGASPSDADAPVCAFSWTRDDDGGRFGPVDSDRRLSLRGCEFETTADADAYADRFEDRYSPDGITAENQTAEELEIDGWSGRVVQHRFEDGERPPLVTAQLVARRGLRVFRVFVQRSAPTSEVVQLAGALAQLQDAHLDAVGADPDRPGAGHVDQAERLSIDDGVIGWADMVGAVGREPDSHGTSYESTITRFDDQRRIEWGRRWLRYDGPTDRSWVIVSAHRYRTPTDAALVLRRLSDGATPSEGIADAWLTTSARSDGTPVVAGHLVTGDRRYEVSADGTFADDPAVVEALLTALAHRLERDGLLEPVGAIESIALGGDTRFAAAALLDAPIPADWSLGHVRVGRDPTKGSVLLDVSYTYGALSETSAVIEVGAPADDFVATFAPDAPAAPPGEWAHWTFERAQVAESGERVVWQDVSVRSVDGIGLLVESDNSLDATADEALEDVPGTADVRAVWEAVGEHLRASLPADVVAADVDAEQRVLLALDERVAFAGEFPASPLVPDRVLALGSPTTWSPPGAVAEWHRIFDSVDGSDVGGNVLRLVRFDEADRARAFVADAFGVVDSIPVAGTDAGGVGTDPDGFGVAAVAVGPWALVIVIRDLSFDPTRSNDRAERAALADDLMGTWLARMRSLALISS